MMGAGGMWSARYKDVASRHRLECRVTRTECNRHRSCRGGPGVGVIPNGGEGGEQEL
jgi:hypothetical protein